MNRSEMHKRIARPHNQVVWLMNWVRDNVPDRNDEMMEAYGKWDRGWNDGTKMLMAMGGTINTPFTDQQQPEEGR